MKKLELILLFFTITLGVVILITTLFKYIKPSFVHIEEASKQMSKLKNKKTFDDSWINKVSKKNQDFIYPTVIYKIKL